MFWASLSLSAILSLILFIGTLVSVLVPEILPGAVLAVTCWLFEEEAGGGVAGAFGAAAAGVGIGAA